MKLEEFATLTEMPPTQDVVPQKTTLGYDEFMGTTPVDVSQEDLGPPAWQSFLSGMGQWNAALARVPAAAYDIAAAPQNFVERMTGWKVGVKASDLPIFQGLESIAKYYDRASESYSYKAKTFPGEDLVSLMQHGEYGRAGEYLFHSLLENAPNSLTAVGGTLLGVPRPALLGIMGAQQGAQTHAEARAKNLDALEAASAALINGGLEAAWESAGTFGLLKWGEELFAGVGQRLGKAILKNVLKLTLGSALGDGNEELWTQLTQDTTNTILGVHDVPWREFPRRAIEAGAIGAFAGASLTGPGAALHGLRTDAVNRDHSRAQRILSSVQLQRATTAPEVGKAITEQLMAVGFTPEQSTTYAKLYESAFTSLGAKAGVNPTELFKRYGLKISRGLAERAPTTTAITEPVAVQSVESIVPPEVKRPARVVRSAVDLVDELQTLRQVTEEISAGQAGYRSQVALGEWIGVPSTFPAYFKNKGYTKKGTLSIIDKVLRGEPLTEQQRMVYNDLLNGKRAELKAQQETYDAEIAAEREQARTEGLTEQQINEAQVAGESAAADEARATELGEQGLEEGPLPDGATDFPFKQSSGRGQFRITPNRQFNIDLLPSADLSTFLHESAHFYLEVISDIATNLNASGDLLTDYQTIREWLGSKSGQAFTVEQHEQFARGFEAYLAEGIAPTSALEAAFKRFNEWLIQIYEDLTKLNVQLTPEVRGVFDRLLTTEDTTDVERADPYNANRTMLGKQVKGSLGSDLRETVDKLFVPISTRLGEVHESLRVAIRKFDFTTELNTQKDLKVIEPILKKFSKLSREDFADLDFALKNRDDARAQQVAAKDKLALQPVRDLLDDIHQRATAVGMKLGYLERYWPRRVQNVTGFLDFIRKSEHWSAIQEAITQREKELGRQLSAEDRVEFINSLIRGFGADQIRLTRPANAKERLIPVLTPEMNRFYKTSPEALYDYIVAMNQAIEQRRFFGKDAETLDKSIGMYVNRLVEQQQITAAEEKTVHDILTARFNQRGTHGFWSLYKNITYMATMGSPISAITQIQDLYYSMLKNGYIWTIWKLPGTMVGKTLISPKALGLDRVAEEFSGTSKTGRAVNKLFRSIGLSYTDGLGKSLVIEGEWKRLRDRARKDPLKLEVALSTVFDAGAKRVVKEIQDGVVSDDVKFLLWSAIADYQPIALSEQPELYLTAGNGRLFYMLKTFTIKQIDVWRREVFSQMKTNPIQATGNLFRMSLALMLMGATSDLIKDFLLGRTFELSDLVIDNILKTVGFSKWQIYKTREDGPLTAFMQSILPPVPFFDDVYKDVMSSRELPDWRIWGRVPIVGKFYFWWLGGGSETTSNF